MAPRASRLSSIKFPSCLKAALALSLAAAAAAPVQAQVQSQAPDREISLRYGEDGDNYEAYGLGLGLRSFWSRGMGSWQMSAHPQIELNRVRYTGNDGGNDYLNALGGLAMLRIQPTTMRFRPYGEVGLGLAYFDHDRVGGKDFGDRIQFTQHIGLGLEVYRNWFAGYRFSHYSNAGMDSDNSGLDLHQVVLGARF